MLRSSFSRMASAGLLFLAGTIASSNVKGQAKSAIGLFEAQTDIGTVLHPGSAHYDSGDKAFTVSGSGENTWFGSDEFHFVWLKASGDVSLAADITLLGTTGKPHRKAMLMIRQSLAPDSPYVDIAVHGVGKTSLQFRDVPGANTRTIASNVYGPRRVMLEKRGSYYYAFLSDKDGVLRFAGSSTRLPLTGEFYVGLGVCAHEKDAVQSARFSNLQYRDETVARPKEQALYSTLETVVVGSKDRQVEYVAPGHLEAPNWSHDGYFFLFNRGGALFRIPVKCGEEDTGCAGASEPNQVALDPAIRCTDNHGISPAGTAVAISGFSPGAHDAVVYTVPVTGGTPRQITPAGPSIWHGWSPDGRSMSFSRAHNAGSDIYTISALGGDERQLTHDSGLNDGAEYSPDGNHLYFNSDRSGSMQIWRMRTDGTGAEQFVSDAYNDWFPHISPDGKWMVFLSYERSVEGTPENQGVILHLVSMNDKKVQVLATLLGGRGTIDAPSWSPDSKRLAFMSYEFLAADDARPQ